MRQVVDYFLPKNIKESQLSVFELRKRRIFIKFCLIPLTALLIFTLQHYFNAKYISSAIDLVGCFLFLASITHYKLTARYESSVYFFILSAAGVVALQNYLSPQELQSNLIWMPLITLVANYLISSKKAFKLFVATLFLGLGSTVLKSMYPLNADHFSIQDSFIVNLFTIFCSSIVGYSFSKNIHNEENISFKTIEKINSEISELYESNSILLNVLCHDLANQMMIAYSHSKILQKKMGAQDKSNIQINEQDFERINKVYKSLSEVKDIIENTRNYTANQKGNIELKTTKVNLNKSIMQALLTVEQKLTNKKIKINTKIESEYEIIAEPISLTNSVIINILTNAIKFSHPESLIEIEVFRNDLHTNLIIRDFGIGIPEDILKNIFSHHNSQTRYGTQNEKGTGLGMPTMKSYLDLYGASVSITSLAHNKGGTTFSILFKNYQSDSAPQTDLSEILAQKAA